MRRHGKIVTCAVALILTFAASLCTGCTAGSYTEEQHIQRVTERAEERFLGEGSEYTGLEVYPIYNEYDELNYMLIELEPQGFEYLCSELEPVSWMPYRVHEGMREEVVDEDGHTSIYTDRELFRDENGDVIIYHLSHFKVAGIENERRYLLSIVSVSHGSGSDALIPAVKRGEQYLNLVDGSGDIIVVNNDGMRSRSAAGIRERVLPVCGQRRG